MKANDNKKRFISMVTIVEKGQIVIPKAARDMFDLKPGDSIVLLADKKRKTRCGATGFCLWKTFFYKVTSTAPEMTRVSGVTLHVTASTLTPAAAACRSAFPKSGSVTSLGCRYFTSSIWITNST